MWAIMMTHMISATICTKQTPAGGRLVSNRKAGNGRHSRARRPTGLEDERAAELDVARVARRRLSMRRREQRADLERRLVADGLERAKLEAHLRGRAGGRGGRGMSEVKGGEGRGATAGGLGASAEQAKAGARAEPESSWPSVRLDRPAVPKTNQPELFLAERS